MLRARFEPMKWVSAHIPRNQAQLEAEFRQILRLAFWVAMLLPVLIVPAYYLVLALIRG